MPHLPYPLTCLSLALTGTLCLYAFPKRLYLGLSLLAVPAGVMLKYGLFSTLTLQASILTNSSPYGNVSLLVIAAHMTMQFLLRHWAQKNLPEHLHFFGTNILFTHHGALDERQALQYQYYATKAYDLLPILSAVLAVCYLALFPLSTDFSQALGLSIVYTSIVVQQTLPLFLACCDHVNTQQEDDLDNND